MGTCGFQWNELWELLTMNYPRSSESSAWPCRRPSRKPAPRRPLSVFVIVVRLPSDAKRNSPPSIPLFRFASRIRVSPKWRSNHPICRAAARNVAFTRLADSAGPFKGERFACCRTLERPTAIGFLVWNGFFAGKNRSGFLSDAKPAHGHFPVRFSV